MAGRPTKDAVKVKQDFEYICLEIEQGVSTRSAIKSFMSTQTFYGILDKNKELSKRYARACEARSELIFDEILDIADESNADVSISEEGKMYIDGEAIQRSKLKIDARKWVLSKMNPKKYGDKIEVDGSMDHTGEVAINLKDLVKFK